MRFQGHETVSIGNRVRENDQLIWPNLFCLLQSQPVQGKMVSKVFERSSVDDQFVFTQNLHFKSRADIFHVSKT